MLMAAGHAPDIGNSKLLNWLRRRLPLTDRYHGGALRVNEHGRRLYTPLFLVIVLVGVTDLIFAVDSIPAIFAITLDPFIVLTSNVFAVLGLRALYFLLAGMADQKKVQLSFVTEPTLDNLMADPVRLRQIFFNLISNRYVSSKFVFYCHNYNCINFLFKLSGIIDLKSFQ